MTNQFCRFLSNGKTISLEQENLVVRPCCWFVDGKNINQDDDFNSIESWTDNCEVCHKQELAGQYSFRQSSFDIIPSDAEGISALDINIDFNCNAACVTCGPEASSLWAKQLKKHKIFYVDSDKKSQNQLDYILNNIDLSNLRRIKFFGGEPLLTSTHLQVLEKIPRPENVSIWYTTNASIYPTQQVMDLWSKFHLVYFEASIDGVADQFEYIRWPLKWCKITENISKLKAQGPTNLLFRINHTLNPFNIYYYDRLEQWVNNNLSTNRLGDATEINLHPCWGQWDLSKTPETLRQAVREKYVNSKIVSMLDQTKQDDHTSILEFTQTWDPIRKVDWQTVFPEITQYF